MDDYGNIKKILKIFSLINDLWSSSLSLNDINNDIKKKVYDKEYI